MACYYLYLRINGLIVMTKIILVAKNVNSYLLIKSSAALVQICSRTVIDDGNDLIE